jgi:hypothetical protein
MLIRRRKTSLSSNHNKELNKKNPKLLRLKPLLLPKPLRLEFKLSHKSRSTNPRNSRNLLRREN